MKKDTSAKKVWMGHSDLIINRCRAQDWAGIEPNAGAAFGFSVLSLF